jgi:hypothetical protein
MGVQTFDHYGANGCRREVLRQSPQDNHDASLYTRANGCASWGSRSIPIHPVGCAPIEAKKHALDACPALKKLFT